MTISFDQFGDGVAVTDGAWGTQLQLHGLPAGACPDVWNLENPLAVEAVARSYVDAGTRVILTNTFRSSPIALSQLQMFWLMEAAFANPFEVSRITSVELDLDLEFSREVHQILDASVAFDEVDPGQEVTIYVRLRQVGRKDTTRAVKVRIPESAAGQTLNLSIDAGNRVRIERPRPASLDDLIKQATERFPATSMVVSLQMPSRGLRFEGHVVDSLEQVLPPIL